MNPFRYVWNALSGRIFHWVETHNKALSEIWSRAEAQSSPFDSIFKQLIVSAGVCLEALLGPDRKNHSILRVDLKSLSKEQFSQLYAVLLTYYVDMFVKTNSWLATPLNSALLAITQQPEVVTKVVESLKSVPANEMSRTSAIVWEHVVGYGKFGAAWNPGQMVFFGLTCGSAYVDALRSIKKEN